ncbi:MAG: porphobilinogen synthase, partial [Promethearchaeota archaeon]
MYPKIRLRRLRNNKLVRSMIQEINLKKTDLIQPLFVKESLNGNEKTPIKSMPGIFQHSIESLVNECKEIQQLGIPAVILFGIPTKRDSLGSEAYNPNGIIPRSVRAIKDELGDDLLVICDVCLCEYTDHGHCAPIRNNIVLNDEGNNLYAKASLEYVKAGADMVAPSGMMDGMIASIRNELDSNNYHNSLILSYAIKFASSFYGPFREAAESGAFKQGPKDRKSHQMDPTNLSQIFIEAELDIKEGADILMVKPALPYLDVIKQISSKYNYPLAAYQVSGEYA